MRRKPARRALPAGVRRSVVVGAIGIMVALPAIAYSLYLDYPVNIAADGQRLMADAAVSLSASVPDNPYGDLAQQLSDKETQLDEREATLAADQAAADQRNAAAKDFGFVSLCISVFLLILVSLNFYLDMRRKRPVVSARERKFLVDLR